MLFETRFGSFDKSPSKEAAKFIAAVKEMFALALKVFLIPVWIDKFYRLKGIQQFYDCMDVMYNFGDLCIENRLNEIREKLENGDFNDEDAAEFLTFLISRDDISSSEITANLVEILMAAVETVLTYNCAFTALSRVDTILVEATLKLMLFLVTTSYWSHH